MGPADAFRRTDSHLRKKRQEISRWGPDLRLPAPQSTSMNPATQFIKRVLPLIPAAEIAFTRRFVRRDRAAQFDCCLAGEIQLLQIDTSQLRFASDKQLRSDQCRKGVKAIATFENRLTGKNGLVSAGV